MKNLLLYITAICWEDVNNTMTVTNIQDLVKTAYVEVSVPHDCDDSKMDQVIKEKLFELTHVNAWYYNCDTICEI